MTTNCIKDALPRALMDLEGWLEDLDETATAIRSALTLVQRVTHLNERVSKLEGWKDEYDPAYDLWSGYQVLAMLASKAAGEVYEACQRFKTVTKSDPVVTAALAAHHEIAPLGPLWTGERYPKE